MHAALGLVFQDCANRANQYMFINADLGRLRKNDQKFKAILYLVVSLRPV